MGNIHHTEGNHSEAINMHRMELDHIPQEEKTLPSKYAVTLNPSRLESTAAQLRIMNVP